MTTPKISPARALILESLIAEIEPVTGHRDHLQELAKRLAAEQGLKLVFQGGTHVARMRGVSASNTAGDMQALEAWARAARRALLNAGAA